VTAADLAAPMLGRDGVWYVTVPAAAERAGTSEDFIRKKFDLLVTANRVTPPRRRGRPISHVVRLDDIEAHRAAVLERLGVNRDAAEEKALRVRLRELESALDELADQYDRVLGTVQAQEAELAALRRLAGDNARMRVNERGDADRP
jgi:hypothetical protein